MFSKSYSLAAALTVAMTSTAIGQTMVGGQEINEGTMPSVEAHCMTLMGGAAPTGEMNPDVAGDAVAGVSGNPDNDELPPETGADGNDLSAPVEADVAAGNAGNSDAEQAESQAEDIASTEEADPEGMTGNPDADEVFEDVNLELITLADCQAAGIGS